MSARRGGIGFTAALLAFFTTAAFAQSPRPGTAGPLTVTAAFDESGWLKADAPLALTLSRVPEPGEGRLAVFVGDVDVSGLLVVNGAGAIYRPRTMPLPRGESEVVAYLVTPDGEWRELARMALRVLAPGGFEKADVTPRLMLNNKGQVAEGHSPESTGPPRPEFQDFSMNLGLQSHHEAGGWRVLSQSNVLGVTHRQEALRFGERQDSAPRVDLSDYLLSIERGPASATIGHVAFGNHRHLLTGFASRGVTTALRMGRIGRLELAGMNGSSVVGWSNLLGLNRSSHRVLGASLGFEVVPSRPGLVHVDVSTVHGAAQPLSGFTQGIVNDAERSRGAGVRLAAALPSQRVSVEAGFARTRFTNPFDAALAGGLAVVEVEPVTRSARYLDLNIALIRGALSPSWPIQVATTFRHERVDPLYRAVGASHIRADLHQDALDVVANLGTAAMRVSHARGHDNLARIGTILSTQTRISTVSVDLPATLLFGARTPAWAPVLTSALTRTHQFADSVPRGGGFADNQVPDQVSLNVSAAAQAQGRIWRVALRHDRSLQDNRQLGRETADFESYVNALSLGLMPLPSLDVSADLAQEHAESQERGQESSTRRLAAGVGWRLTRTTTLSGAVSNTRTTDEPRTTDQLATDVRFELSQRLVLFGARSGRTPGQVFVRYSRVVGERADVGLPVFSQRSWTINTGATLSLF